MKISERPSLKSLNTFGVEAHAALRIDIESEEDILALPSLDPSRDLLLGGGSNILLASDVPGTVFLNRIRGRQVVKQSQSDVVVEVGAGENWHELVKWSLEQGYSGLENLALIPGSVGAAPIQNIGAYGVELASLLDSVTAWDSRLQSWKILDADECEFGYRDSLFKSTQPGRFLITSIRLSLSRDFTPRITYKALAEELGEPAPAGLTARDVYEAVIRIRSRKLPDPATIGNAGSFFKNPVVSSAQAGPILRAHPDLPTWPAANGQIKLSAAWMIERCGLKGHSKGPAGVSDLHALVLINRGGASGEQILALAQQVRAVVEEKFEVRLQYEPRIVQFKDI
jgi:UDP-N-acetylmuramate dehydrogenase